MKTIIKILASITVISATAVMYVNYDYARGGIILFPVLITLLIWLLPKMYRDWHAVMLDTYELEDDAYVRYFREGTGQDITEVLKGEEIICQ